MKVTTSPSVLLVLATGFADLVIWSLIGDDFSGFAVVVAKAYFPPKIACLEIILLSVGNCFLEC
jgi:hypothetical protein